MTQTAGKSEYIIVAQGPKVLYGYPKYMSISGLTGVRENAHHFATRACAERNIPAIRRLMPDNPVYGATEFCVEAVPATGRGEDYTVVR